MPQLPSRTPTLSELLNLVAQATKAGLRVALPGRVESYDATTQQASVKPLLMDRSLGEDGEPQTHSLGVVNNVPVVQLAGGGFRITVPVAAGDEVLLVFADRALDTWLAQGGEVDPGEDRTHHLTDAIAIPGLHNSQRPLTGASTSSLTIGKDGGMQLEVTASQAKFGGGSTPVAKEGSTTVGHVHPVVGTAGPFPVVATATVVTDAIAPGQGSQNVRVP